LEVGMKRKEPTKEAFGKKERRLNQKTRGKREKSEKEEDPPKELLTARAKVVQGRQRTEEKKRSKNLGGEGQKTVPIGKWVRQKTKSLVNDTLLQIIKKKIGKGKGAQWGWHNGWAQGGASRDSVKPGGGGAKNCRTKRGGIILDKQKKGRRRTNIKGKFGKGFGPTTRGKAARENS